MPFASDAFAGAAAQELSVYSGSWSKQSGFTADFSIGVGGQYACCFNAAATACYQHSASPAGADYSVQADITRLAVSASFKPSMGVCGRMASGAATFYWTYHVDASNQTRLYKTVAAATTLLGTYANTLTTGVAQVHELRMTGTTIEVYIDSVQRISVTDSSITAAGKAGLIGTIMRETSVQDVGSIDNWSATDAAASSDLSGNVTLDAVAPAGTLADGGASGISGNVTLDVVAPAGTLGVAPGVVTVPALKNWSGSLQTSVTIPVVTVLSMTTGAQVLALTDQVTDATTADLEITSTSLVAGTTYMVAGWNADGSQRFAVPLTAA